MTHDVFISYSHEDESVASAVYAALESEKIGCWMAPRDILPGTDYPEAIISAIENCKVFIVIFSAHSNHSPHVRTELEKAMKCRIPMIPLRIATVPMTPHMEYFIGSYQWLDALDEPLEKHWSRLMQAVQALLHNGQPEPTGKSIIQKSDYGESPVKVNAKSELSNSPSGNVFRSLERQKLRLIPGGEFFLKKERRNVKIAPFYMGICPVTNLEYERFDPEHRNWRNQYSNADDEPVVYVTWDNVNCYSEWLSQKTGETYRLPDEMEWEYACRAGSNGLYSLDIYGKEVDETNLQNYAVFNREKTMPVKQRKSNSFGLYDMHGNVWEWCWDYYDDNKEFPVLRGGSWSNTAEYLHSSYRNYKYPDHVFNYVGFRVVMIARTQKNF
jgi:hypothetical protein